MRRLAFAVVLLVVQLPAAAESSCLKHESLEACTNRVLDEVSAAGRRAQLRGQREQLEKRETGIDTSLAGSTLKNLLPLASLSGLVGAAGNAAQGALTPLALDLNLPLPDGAPGRNGQLQAETLGQPGLAAPVRDALEQAGKDNLIDKLERTLEALDDSALAFTYSFQHYDLGRDFEDYAPRLDALLLQVSRRSTSKLERKARGQRRKLLEKYAGDLPESDDFRFDEIGCKDGEACTPAAQAKYARIQQELMDAVARAAQASGEGELELGQQIRENQLDRFVDLVNNQPLLYLTVRRLLRDPLVGAEADSLKLGLEWGTANLWGFLRRDGKVCKAGGRDWNNEYHAAGNDCLDRYAQYVKAHDAELRDAARWQFSAEYARIDDLDVEVPEAGLKLHVPGSDRWGVSGGYGRYLQLGLPGESRVDAQGKYERYDGPAIEGERYSFSVVLTQKVAGLSLPFTLFYRSKDEFLVDESDLGAMVGLNYDLFGAAPALPLLPSLMNVVPVADDPGAAAARPE